MLDDTKTRVRAAATGATSGRHEAVQAIAEGWVVKGRDPPVMGGTLRHSWIVARAWVPLALVITALIGSVVVPARQTWLISSLLRQTTAVLGPARLLAAQLQSGLTEENDALQSYAFFGDSAALEQYRVIAAEDDQRLSVLARLSARLDAKSVARVTAVRREVDVWRGISQALIDRRASRAEFAAAIRAGTSRNSASVTAMGDLRLHLAAEGDARDDRVRELEHVSLFSNAGLVFVAFAALYAVMILTVRERRLAASLRVRIEEQTARARQEVALREAAEALASAFTLEEVTQRIAAAALVVVEGRAAFVEQITSGPGESSDILTVGAVAGTDVAPLESACTYAGSHTERVLQGGESILIPDLGPPDQFGTRSTVTTAPGPSIAVPLVSRGAPMGALFVLSERGHFRSTDVARAAMLGHLAALAYEKVKLLDEAIEGRLKLQRVMTSRSRLMRGFSHDVKNPIGAAEGYAELLSDGIYGDLNARQQESVSRLRRCLHGALALIDELHELARAETGHLAIASAPVEIADLVRGIGEEYQAVAAASGLSLSVEVEADLPTVHTSNSRVGQIASNLLSNAIKYTESGSVTVRAVRRTSGPFGDRGDWLLIEVVDTGPGIPSEKFEVIFEEFRRIGETAKAGAGLGLAISRLLAQALGGHISVKSEIAHGSTFTLWLPVTASDLLVSRPVMRRDERSGATMMAPIATS
jgi:signal transduction histidine kinase